MTRHLQDFSPELLAGRENIPRLPSQENPPGHAVSYWLNTWGRTHRLYLLIGINPDKMQGRELPSCPSPCPPAGCCRPDLASLDHILCRKLEALCQVSSNVGQRLFGEGAYRGSCLTWERLYPTWSLKKPPRPLHKEAEHIDICQ